MCATPKPVHTRPLTLAHALVLPSLFGRGTPHTQSLVAGRSCFLRERRERAACFQKYTKTHPRTHEKVSGNVHEACQEDRCVNHAQLCAFKAMPGGIVLCAGWDMKHSFCPRPRQNAEKGWCFRGKKVASEICVSWRGPTQTQLLTQLSPKHNF